MRSMVLLTMLAILLTVALTPIALADTIPSFVLTQGNILVSPGSDVIGNTHFSLSGTGVSISGTGTVGSGMGFSDGSPGSAQTPALEIWCCSSFATVTIGSAVHNGVIFTGGVGAVNGASFVLPALTGTDGSKFQITLPVLFTGTFSGCPGNDSDGCTGPTIANFAFTPHGKVTLTYIEDSEAGLWRWNSAEYKLTAVPEPGTLAFVATGLLGAAGRWVRRGHTKRS